MNQSSGIEIELCLAACERHGLPRKTFRSTLEGSQAYGLAKFLSEIPKNLADEASSQHKLGAQKQNPCQGEASF